MPLVVAGVKVLELRRAEVGFSARGLRGGNDSQLVGLREFVRILTQQC